MNKAKNHQLLIDSARTDFERATQIELAKNESVAQIYNNDGSLSELEFADGSTITLN